MAIKSDEVEQAKRAALDVLLHNMHGSFDGLPRTAGWGYPEPYTRDLMISSLGTLASGNPKLTSSLRHVLETLAKNQSPRGLIPSLVHEPKDRGGSSSDTTPLFLFAVACYRRATGDVSFLEKTVQKAMTWMDYQSPSDRIMVAQQPTSDWRDEQWVLGFALFVNAVVYSYLRLYGEQEKANLLRSLINRPTLTADVKHRHDPEGLAVPKKAYYALWSYKIHSSERFDLLGNSLAILSGIASSSRANAIISWVEGECARMRKNGELIGDLPPNLFPFIRQGDPDWRPRYATYNQPGEYHNGGIWPFVSSFYVAALVAAGRHRLAVKKLEALTTIVRPARKAKVVFGFNEWLRAQDGVPCGQDWQTWSAAMYLYAAISVDQRETPFFSEVRSIFHSAAKNRKKKVSSLG